MSDKAMKIITATLLVLLSVSAFAQQPTLTFSPESAHMLQTNPTLNVSESQIKIGNTALYVRVIGNGQPLIVLHGGPDFDHSYFLPDLDRLKDTFRLIYYDQRGRGRSADKVKPEDVTLMSDLEDLDRLADRFRLIYYDQRGRGKSADNVRPEDVTLVSDLDDIDR